MFIISAPVTDVIVSSLTDSCENKTKRKKKKKKKRWNENKRTKITLPLLSFNWVKVQLST